MNNRNQLSEKWIKASIIGTIWAASEIVLGSFLHNLKIPFSGNILTGIGIVILISINHTWADKGLFWRAGLICAIMKTMSPSAVIFGPMIAIFSEAILLEISVRLMGRTFLAYMIGAMLAMSWNLFQKIINYLIFYGFNIVELYSSLLNFTQKQLAIQHNIVWLPIIILLVIYCVLGLLSAVVGIRVGRRMLKESADFNPNQATASAKVNKKVKSPETVYSLSWLFADLLMLLGSLYLLNYTSWMIWSPIIIGIVTFWAFRYQRALRQLSKPKFWISFVLITMASALLFSSLGAGSNSLSEGLYIGFQMNFRAVIIIVGFAVLGTELYNPRIRSFFLKTSFKQLPLALELSFESLPSMIAHMPKFKTILKNPVTVLYQVISQAESRLDNVKRRLSRKVIIVSGSVGQGKTSYLLEVVKECNKRDISTGGICSLRVMEGNLTIGYDLLDISSGERVTFLRKNGDQNSGKIGKYTILQQGLALGSKALSPILNKQNKIVLVDEVGTLELDDKGWGENISELLNAGNNHLLLAVRNTFVQQVIDKWRLEGCIVYDLARVDETTLSRNIIELIEDKHEEDYP